MKIHCILLIVISLFFFPKCKDSGKDVEDVLAKAGSNRHELEKVIQHYKDLHDKEKLKAAYFLIGNMQNKSGRYGEIVKNYFPVFEKIHVLNDLKIDKDTIDKRIKMAWDSVERVAGPITNENYPTYYDYYVISAEYLIENIDMSFKAWKEKPWAKHLNFDQFCEYILPYRLYDEPLQFYKKRFYDEFEWLQDSLKDKSDPVEACLALNKYLAKNFIFCNQLDRCPKLGINDMYTLNAGTCDHRYHLVASIMRSVGIPVAVDFTPQWRNWVGNHFWLVLIDKKGKARSFNGGEPLTIIADSVYVPLGIRGRTTKVYRATFAEQQNAISSKLSPGGVPDLFKNSCMIDVTDEYVFPQTKIKFELKVIPSENFKKYTFLSCFGYSYQITPVDYTKCSGSSATFHHIGTDAVYLPVYCNNDAFVVANNPCYFSDKGTQQLLSPNYSKFITVKLTRKFSCGGNMNDYTKWMVGAKFQASDNEDFNNPVTLFTIDTLYYHFAEKDINPDKPYRYYRYLSADTGKIRIAEIDFVTAGMENLVAKNKNYKIYGYAKKDTLMPSPIFENAFDGNIRTNFNAPAGSWVAIDYLKPTKISKIRFLARNDLNIIEIGDKYELLFFDFGWKSLGVKIADKNYVVFDNVPDNTLLVLRDLTKGRDERIFRYCNGQQQWL